ncbi:MAG: ribosome silencing factor [Planctomycetes bacterium]|nr:ribosome silencing factor [Planctomycetota bacterium]NOG55921.1 ribosome silencing factor [Planctomycetota bacterium]
MSKNRIPKSTPEERRAQAEHFAIEAARLIADLKCEDVLVVDVHGLSKVTDYIVIGTGTSARQMHSVAEDIVELAGELGHVVFRANQERGSSWVVIDCVDVTVHMFDTETRAFYDLETLWIDGTRLKWARP